MALEMKYFVLKPRGKHHDDKYAIASQAAMFAYADSIEDSDINFAEQLRSWGRAEIARMGAMQRGLKF